MMAQEKIVTEGVKDTQPNILLQVNEFLEKLLALEKEYHKQKDELDIAEAKILTGTNWKELNAEREAQLLPKITNESGRKAYVTLKLSTQIEELHRVSEAYSQMKRQYEILFRK